MSLALSALRTVAAISAGLAVLAGPPSPAEAKPGYRVFEGWRAPSLTVKGANGYRVEVGALGNRVTLSATAGGVSAAYAVRGRSDGRRLEARFGALGRVSLRLRPLGPSVPIRGTQYGCEGRESTRRPVRFTGSVRFRGEHGFTTVRSSGGRGTEYRGYRLVCEKADGWRDPDSLLKTDGLVARPDGERSGLRFIAHRISAPSIGLFGLGPAFSARLTERRGRVSIERLATVGGEEADLALSRKGAAPVTATVKPPAPFSGTANLVKEPGEPARWEGDLSVELPGHGTLNLAGPSFGVRICRRAPISCAAPELSELLKEGPILPAGR